MDIRQSPAFASYLAATGWTSQKLSDNTYCFILTLGGLGSILRIPRPKPPILFGEIDTLARKRQSVFVKLDPDAPSGNTKLLTSLTKHRYGWDNWSPEPSATRIIDLTCPEDILLSDLRKQWRRNIRIAQKAGISIAYSKDIDTFIRLWQQNARRKGFVIEPAEATKVFFDAFQKKQGVQMLFATKDRLPVAASMVFYQGTRAHLWHLAYSGEFAEHEPLYLLMWETLIRAKSHGAKHFDMEGIADGRLPISKKIQPSYFKMGFGGTHYEYIGPFVKYYRPVIALPYKVLSAFKPDAFFGLYWLSRFFHGT